MWDMGITALRDHILYEAEEGGALGQIKDARNGSKEYLRILSKVQAHGTVPPSSSSSPDLRVRSHSTSAPKVRI